MNNVTTPNLTKILSPRFFLRNHKPLPEKWSIFMNKLLITNIKSTLHSSKVMIMKKTGTLGENINSTLDNLILWKLWKQLSYSVKLETMFTITKPQKCQNSPKKTSKFLLTALMEKLMLSLKPSVKMKKTKITGMIIENTVTLPENVTLTNLRNFWIS